MENDSHSRALLGAHGMNKELRRRMLTDPPTNRTPGSAEECSQTRSPLTGLHYAQMSTTGVPLQARQFCLECPPSQSPMLKSPLWHTTATPLLPEAPLSSLHFTLLARRSSLAPLIPPY